MHRVGSAVQQALSMTMRMAAGRSVGAWALSRVLCATGFSLFPFIGYYLVAQNIACKEKGCINQCDFHMVLTSRSCMSITYEQSRW